MFAGFWFLFFILRDRRQRPRAVPIESFMDGKALSIISRYLVTALIRSGRIILGNIKYRRHAFLPQSCRLAFGLPVRGGGYEPFDTACRFRKS